MSLWKVIGFALCALFVVLLVAMVRVTSTARALRRTTRRAVNAQRHQPRHTLAATA